MIYEENGKIIVDELRPMSEVPTDEQFLALNKHNDFIVVAYNKIYGIHDSEEFIYPDKYFIGFIPMPEYRRKE